MDALLTRTFSCAQVKRVGGWRWEQIPVQVGCCAPGLPAEEGKRPVWEGEREAGGKWLEVLRKTAGCLACPPVTFSTPDTASCSWNCCSCRVSPGVLQELAHLSPAALPPRLAPQPQEWAKHWRLLRRSCQCVNFGLFLGFVFCSLWIKGGW